MLGELRNRDIRMSVAVQIEDFDISREVAALTAGRTDIGAIVTFKALTIESHNGDPIGAIAWRPLIIILGAVAVFGFALPRLGLITTIPLLIAISSLAGDTFNWIEVVILSVVLTVLSYLVFVAGLSLVLPLWPSFLG